MYFQDSLVDYDNILWDFDGVLMNSMPVRNQGFEMVLSSYPKDQVDTLMRFHLENGGLSRYVKFRYFFEEIRKESVSDDKINYLSEQFSEIMRMNLLNRDLLIKDSIGFIKNSKDKFNMHIVSGSDERELQFLCDQLGILNLFISIHGSPTPKTKIVDSIILNNKYQKDRTLLIGDSVNDYDAAIVNGIQFSGYNNPSLSCYNYIDSFENLNWSI